jgi:hypothetical protein
MRDLFGCICLSFLPCFVEGHDHRGCPIEGSSLKIRYCSASLNDMLILNSLHVIAR